MAVISAVSNPGLLLSFIVGTPSRSASVRPTGGCRPRRPGSRKFASGSEAAAGARAVKFNARLTPNVHALRLACSAYRIERHGPDPVPSPPSPRVIGTVFVCQFPHRTSCRDRRTLFPEWIGHHGFAGG